MATHGSVVQFDPEKEEWTSYMECLNYYLIANEVKEDAKKCAILMSGCGPTTYKIIRRLVDSETRKTIKYSKLIDLLTSHFNPRPLSIVQRFKFYNRTRSKEESIATYVAALRALAEYCEYGDSLNIMLRDRLVCGVNHEGIQRRLLSEKDLTYEKALEIALAMEAAAKDTRDLLAASNTPTGLHYIATGGGSFKNRSGRVCNAECPRCKKIGHIAKVCRSKSTAPRPTHYMQNSEISQTEDTSYDLFMTQEVDKTCDPIVITLELNGVPLDMELDTGASLTLLNKSTYKAITHDASTGLQPSDAQLRTYTGQLVEILGTTTVHAKYGEQLLQLPVYVVDGGGPNLLGRDWLGKFKIKLTNVCTLMAPDKLNQVLNTHSQVFEEGLGTLNNVKVNLAIDPSVPPKFHKARSIPFALKEKVELELQRLEELGIISPVTHSEWAAPLYLL